MGRFLRKLTQVEISPADYASNENLSQGMKSWIWTKSFLLNPPLGFQVRCLDVEIYEELQGKIGALPLEESSLFRLFKIRQVDRFQLHRWQGGNEFPHDMVVSGLVLFRLASVLRYSYSWTGDCY